MFLRSYFLILCPGTWGRGGGSVELVSQEKYSMGFLGEVRVTPAHRAAELRVCTSTRLLALESKVPTG